MSKKKYVPIPTFPKFRPLTLDDRDMWNDLIKDYPPIGDISFHGVANWWASLDFCKISSIDKNTIISYWIPGDELNSGLSIIGTRDVDQAICTIFDWQRAGGHQCRLVHVPEFVVENIMHPELFLFEGDRDYDECILPVRRYLSVEDMPLLLRKRARHFFINYEVSDITVEPLSVEKPIIKDLILSKDEQWKHMKKLNSLNQHEEICFANAIKYSANLDIEAVGVYLKGSLQAILLFSLPSDGRYIILNYARYCYDRPRFFEASLLAIASYFSSLGVKYVNIDSDFGNKTLRALKVTVGASNFFRKYGIKPRGDTLDTN